MQLVPVAEIPTAIDTPLGDLVAIYRTFIQMQQVCKRENGAGLSAVQVGIPWKMFIVQANSSHDCYLNCIYEPVGDEKVSSIEGCLSLKDANGDFRNFRVVRSTQVQVTGKKLLAEDRPEVVDVDMLLDGFQSVLFQHEIDHQNGILISDIGEEVHVYESF